MSYKMKEIMKIIFYTALVLLAACQIKSTDKPTGTQQKRIEYRTINDNSMINLYDAFGKNNNGMVIYIDTRDQVIIYCHGDECAYAVDMPKTESEAIDFLRTHHSIEENKKIKKLISLIISRS